MNKSLNKILIRLFDTSDGKELMKYLEDSYFNRMSFNKDPYMTAFNEGGREVVADIKKRIEDGKRTN